jgi:hypothetical protein
MLHASVLSSAKARLGWTRSHWALGFDVRDAQLGCRQGRRRGRRGDIVFRTCLAVIVTSECNNSVLAVVSLALWWKLCRSSSNQ